MKAIALPQEMIAEKALPPLWMLLTLARFGQVWSEMHLLLMS